MKFYNLGEVRRREVGEDANSRLGDFESAPDEFAAARVAVGASEFYVVFPKFLDASLYSELANTLASRFAMESGTLDLGVPERLSGRAAWNSLRASGAVGVEGQGFIHHWRGLDVPILVFIKEV